MESPALSDSHQIKLNAQSGIITSNAIPVPLVTAWPKPPLCLNTNFPACSTLEMNTYERAAYRNRPRSLLRFSSSE